MPSPTKKQFKIEPRTNEEPMEVDSTDPSSKVVPPTVQTPKTKKNAQSKLTSFFGSAAKVKKEVEEERVHDDSKSESSGLKSPKKEAASPQKSPKKNTEGKKNDKKEKMKEKTKKVVIMKKEPKEEEETEEETENEKEKGEEEEEGEGNDGSENEPEYEVEKILSHKWDKDGVLQFKVKWVGYVEEEATDEPEENVESAKLLVEEYLRCLPTKAKEEFERRTKRKIGSPMKGKKRPISETIQKVEVKTERVEEEKKMKKEEKKEKEMKKEKKAKEKKEEKKEKEKKEKKDFFKKSSGVASKSESENTKKGGEKKKSKSSSVTVKKEPLDVEEMLKKMEETRKKAFDYESEDKIGGVIQKAVEALIKMINTDFDPEKVALANESLKNERAAVLKHDKVYETKSDPLRETAFKVCEKMEEAFDVLIVDEIKYRTEIKKEVEEKEKEGGEEEKGEKGEKEGLFAVSDVGVQGVEVKAENEEQRMEQVKDEA